MTMKKLIYDRKSPLTMSIFGTLNKLVLPAKFAAIDFIGQENIPGRGPFLLVANHISRWDGLLLQYLIDRPANYMVSPNELTGLQGLIIRSVGAFPADPRFDLHRFVRAQMDKGEALVIFPEGNIFTDGRTHPFKNGAARLALNCAAAGVDLPVIPMALEYVNINNGKDTARCLIGCPIDLKAYVREFREQSNMGIRSLTVRLEREVLILRESLGASADGMRLLSGEPLRMWVPRGVNSAI